jgi:hypothetical protein
LEVLSKKDIEVRMQETKLWTPEELARQPHASHVAYSKA